MQRCLPILLVALSANVYAAPATAEDDLARFVAERSLGSRIEQLAHNVKGGAVAVKERASDLVFTAMGFLGVPYRRGGNSAETGFDCSGFVRAIYRDTVGLILPRRADEQAAQLPAVDRQDLQPGDLVFFNTLRRAFSHVGIYVGDGKFIHSPKPGAQVRVENMSGGYWTTRFDGARRVYTNVPLLAVPTMSAGASASSPAVEVRAVSMQSALPQAIPALLP